jgi:hypothetical protein
VQRAGDYGWKKAVSDCTVCLHRGQTQMSSSLQQPKNLQFATTIYTQTTKADLKVEETKKL